MNRSRLLAAALLAACASCIEVTHFGGEPARYDGLYFGPAEHEVERNSIDETAWRIYALYGLVPYSPRATEFAGNRLAEVAVEERPLRIAVDTEYSFLNGLSAFGVNVLLGIFGPLVYVPRVTHVEGWRDEPAPPPAVKARPAE